MDDKETRQWAHRLLTASDEELQSGDIGFPKVSFVEACQGMETFGETLKRGFVMYNQQPQQEVVIYKHHASFAHMATRTAQQWFERDLKQRTKQGWRLVSVQPTGVDVFRKPILTAIYERAR